MTTCNQFEDVMITYKKLHQHDGGNSSGSGCKVIVGNHHSGKQIKKKKLKRRNSKRTVGLQTICEWDKVASASESSGFMRKVMLQPRLLDCTSTDEEKYYRGVAESFEVAQNTKLPNREMEDYQSSDSSSHAIRAALGSLASTPLSVSYHSSDSSNQSPVEIIKPPDPISSKKNQIILSDLFRDFTLRSVECTYTDQLNIFKGMSYGDCDADYSRLEASYNEAMAAAEETFDALLGLTLSDSYASHCSSVSQQTEISSRSVAVESLPSFLRKRASVHNNNVLQNLNISTSTMASMQNDQKTVVKKIKEKQISKSTQPIDDSKTNRKTHPEKSDPPNSPNAWQHAARPTLRAPDKMTVFKVPLCTTAAETALALQITPPSSSFPFPILAAQSESPEYEMSKLTEACTSVVVNNINLSAKRHHQMSGGSRKLESFGPKSISTTLLQKEPEVTEEDIIRIASTGLLPEHMQPQRFKTTFNLPEEGSNFKIQNDVMYYGSKVPGGRKSTKDSEPELIRRTNKNSIADSRGDSLQGVGWSLRNLKSFTKFPMKSALKKRQSSTVRSPTFASDGVTDSEGSRDSPLSGADTRRNTFTINKLNSNHTRKSISKSAFENVEPQEEYIPFAEPHKEPPIEPVTPGSTLAKLTSPLRRRITSTSSVRSVTARRSTSSRIKKQSISPVTPLQGSGQRQKSIFASETGEEPIQKLFQTVSNLKSALKSTIPERTRLRKEVAILTHQLTERNEAVLNKKQKMDTIMKHTHTKIERVTKAKESLRKQCAGLTTQLQQLMLERDELKEQRDYLLEELGKNAKIQGGSMAQKLVGKLEDAQIKVRKLERRTSFQQKKIQLLQHLCEKTNEDAMQVIDHNGDDPEPEQISDTSLQDSQVWCLVDSICGDRKSSPVWYHSLQQELSEAIQVASRPLLATQKSRRSSSIFGSNHISLADREEAIKTLTTTTATLVDRCFEDATNLFMRLHGSLRSFLRDVPPHLSLSIPKVESEGIEDLMGEDQSLLKSLAAKLRDSRTSSTPAPPILPKTTSLAFNNVLRAAALKRVPSVQKVPPRHAPAASTTLISGDLLVPEGGSDGKSIAKAARKMMHTGLLCNTGK